MRFDYLKTAEYQELVTTLENPVRLCNLAHENVLLSIEGTPILPIAYVKECTEQHLGCPHLLNTLLRDSRSLLERHLGTRGGHEGHRILSELENLRLELVGIDNDLRQARTGTSSARVLELIGHVSPATPQEFAKIRDLEAQAITHMSKIEELRPQILALVLQTPPIIQIIKSKLWQILVSEESGLQCLHASPSASHTLVDQ